MTFTRAIHLCAIELASEEDGAPAWVQLTPAGPNILARDGRQFRLLRPQVILEAFRELGRPLQIDIEHASQVRAPKGLSNPAVGWVVEMEVRDGAIWGRVDWTERGRAWVVAREYRFLSPAFTHEAGEMVEIVSVGLTNEPAFRMTELARAGEEEKTMDPDILEELGLKADATAQEAVGKIKSLKGDIETARSAMPDRETYVPKAQHDAALARIDKFEKDEAARSDAELTGLVDQGVADGKIAPAAKEDFIEMARAQGAEKFKATLDKMPKVISDTTAMDDKIKDAAGKATLSPDEIAVARQMGWTDEQFLAAQKEVEK